MYLILFLIQYVNGQYAPVVNTSQGLVRGLVAEDEGYHMYLGIPYAVVDDANPFGHSLPHPGFNGTFDAFDDSAICPQIEEFNETLTGTLDCLHLSVFVPTSISEEPRPVLFWIYGGRFEIGFYGRFLYGPKYLVRHDIILVFINYRLGPYGFMCTDNPRVPGNQGLKDQMAALKWVQDNIGNFGGDPNRVTIAGNSAGGMSSDFHIVRNYYPRLFNQAILQSGTTLVPSFPFPDRDAPLTLSKHFGFETDDISVALDFLGTVDPLEVINASTILGFVFRPCIENTFEGVENFIIHNWVRNETIPFAKELNLIIGFTDDESLPGFALSSRNLTTAVNDSLTVTFDIDHEDFVGIDQVTNFYFGDEVIDQDLMFEAADLTSDLTFLYPAIRSTARFLKNEVQKVFLYVFSYNGGRNFVKDRLNVSIGGACHADETGYLFDIEYMDTPTAEDQLAVDRMTEMWANFVKYGDPTPETSELLPLKWEPIMASSPYHYMDIGSELRVGTRLMNERMTFWDVFFEQNRDLQLFLLEDSRRIDKQILDEVITY